MREESARTVPLYVASIRGALVVSALLVSATGGSARAVFEALLDGSIRSPGAWGLTLTTMAPLLLVAIGAVAATRAGLINIGQEGQLLVGACFGAYLAVRFPGPGRSSSSSRCSSPRSAAGSGPGSPPLLKAWRNVPEVLTTLLLTFISFPLITFGLRHRWLIGDRDTERIRHINSGEQIPFDTRFPDIGLFGNRIDSAVVLAVGAAADRRRTCSAGPGSVRASMCSVSIHAPPSASAYRSARLPPAC